MQVLLVYNPKAGQKVFLDQLDGVVASFQKQGETVLMHRMDDADAFRSFFSSLSEKDFSKVIAAGGDGTVNLVMGEIMKAKWQVPVGIYPAGTANDFASYFELPKEVKKATEVILKGKPVSVDVGCANGNHFINVLSLGYLVDVPEKTDTRAKNALGILAYYLKGIEEAVNPTFTKVKLTGEGVLFEGEIFLMLVLNGSSAGGFSKMLGEASMEDGMLDILIFKKCPVLEILPLFLKLMNGEHIKSPHVLHFKSADFKIETKEALKADIDGEIRIDCPITVKVRHGAVNVIAP